MTVQELSTISPQDTNLMYISHVERNTNFFAMMHIQDTTGIKYHRNLNFVLYNEVVYNNGEIIGAIYEDKENGGFSIKKEIETDGGPEYIFIGNFDTVSDAKEFINNAGTL